MGTEIESERAKSAANGLIALTSLNVCVDRIKNSHRSIERASGNEREMCSAHKNHIKVNYFRLDLNLQISAKRKEMYSLSYYNIHFLGPIGRCAFPLSIANCLCRCRCAGQAADLSRARAPLFFLHLIFFSFVCVCAQSEVKPSKTELRSTETKQNHNEREKAKKRDTNS